uniref:DNA processing protein n=1 Tax=Pseudomonas phage Arace01 TaxID=3138526 RepID=A0AAU6VZT0_9VIRU
MKITVANKHHGAVGEYIGRGSPLGNPSPITPLNTRYQAIENYKVWLADKIKTNDERVCTELNRLANIVHETGELTLVCFCKPHACHGDVIRQVILEAFKE